MGFILISLLRVPDKHQLVYSSSSSEPEDCDHDESFAGHFSVKKMSKRIGRYFYWKGMNADVLKKCKSYVSCASVQGCSFVGKPF